MLIYGKNPLKETNPKDIKKIYLNKNLVNKEIFEYIKQQKIFKKIILMLNLSALMKKLENYVQI